MKRKILSGILIGILVITAGGWAAVKVFWTKHVTASLVIPTLQAEAPAVIFKPTLTPTQAATEVPLSTSTSAAPQEVIIVPTETETPTPTPACKGPENMILLAVGIDYRGAGGDYLYGLADVIRIIRIDFTKPSVSMLAIPRDLRVKVPGLENHGIEYTKINQSYFYGTEAMGYYEGQAHGAGLLAETLYYNFGIFPDHYGVVSMQAMEKIINTVGGIDVTLETAVDGNVNGKENGYYAAGTHHFNGATAVLFARIREGYSDLDRIDNQTIVLKALYKKMMSDEVRPKLPQILGDFLLSNMLLTDIAADDLPMYLCVAQKIQKEDIRVATLPRDTFSGQMIYLNNKTGVFYYVPDMTKLIQVFNDFKQGTWP